VLEKKWETIWEEIVRILRIVKGINPHYSQKLDPVGRFHTSLTKTT
jgi:hypothetical protein